MMWLGLLVVVAVLVAVVALSGIGPRGARPVAGTQLMSGARMVLAILLAVVAYMVWAR